MEAIGHSLGITGTPAWTTVAYAVISAAGPSAELDYLLALALSSGVSIAPPTVRSALVPSDRAPPRPDGHRELAALPGESP